MFKKQCLSAHFLTANMENCHIVAEVVVNLITNIIFSLLTGISIIGEDCNLLSNKDFF